MQPPGNDPFGTSAAGHGAGGQAKPGFLETFNRAASFSSTSPSRPRAGTLPSTLGIGTPTPAFSRTEPAAGASIRPDQVRRHLSNLSLSGVPPGFGQSAGGGLGSTSLPVSGLSTPNEYPASQGFSSGLLALPSSSLSGQRPLSATNSAAAAAAAAVQRYRSGSLTLPAHDPFGSNAFAAPGSAAANGSISGWSASSGQRSPGGASLLLPLQTDAASLREAEHSLGGDADVSAGSADQLRTLDYLGLDNDSPTGGFGPFASDDQAAPGLATIHSATSFSNLPSTANIDASEPEGLHHGTSGSTFHRLRAHTLGVGPTFAKSSSDTHLPGLGGFGIGSLALPNNDEEGYHSSKEYFHQPHGPVGATRAYRANTYAPTSSSNTTMPPALQAQAQRGHSNSNASSLHHSSDSGDSRLLYSSSSAAYQQPPSRPSPPLTPPLGGLNGQSAPLAGVHSPSRGRAATIGIGGFGFGPGSAGDLDAGGRRVIARDGLVHLTTNSDGRKRAGTTSGLFSRRSEDEVTGYGAAALAQPAPIPRVNSNLNLSVPNVAGTRSRPLSPDTLAFVPTPPQQPTRSLWIGNLDPNTAPGDLQSVFEVYGLIESTRILPEKECGFVNFFAVPDAIRAKEDILNRQESTLSTTGGMIRIGFARADTAPAASAPARPFTGGAPFRDNSRESREPNDTNPNTPSRSLYIGSMPAETTSAYLMSIFGRFGSIESIRTLPQKFCAFINFERAEDAVTARKSLNGKDILGAETGPVRIGFAKAPERRSAPAEQHGSMYHAPASYEHRGEWEGHRGYLEAGAHQLEHSEVPHEPEALVETVLPLATENLRVVVKTLCGDLPDLDEFVNMVSHDQSVNTTYQMHVDPPATNDGSRHRGGMLDSPQLRELRKTLDGHCSQEQADKIAADIFEECIPLASDYLGNTVVQRVFENASAQVRISLLSRMAPHLASIGVHKNGTWAVQKLIACARTVEEFELIRDHLRPWTPALLLNDLGNYVIQGTLRFGTPFTDYIFDAMVQKCWEIGSGRFGARSTRQTLESPFLTSWQLRRVALSISLNAVPLSVDINGAILVTWLLESSNLPGRYITLATAFAPHLQRLCRHRLASMTVLKIINQRSDAAASEKLLEALFDAEGTTLQTVLVDPMIGVGTITKIVNALEPEHEQRRNQVKQTLANLRLEHQPPYRKLAEVLGLVPRSTSRSRSHGGRHGGGHHQQHQQLQHQQQQYPASSSPMYGSMPSATYAATQAMYSNAPYYSYQYDHFQQGYGYPSGTSPGLSPGPSQLPGSGSPLMSNAGGLFPFSAATGYGAPSPDPFAQPFVPQAAPFGYSPQGYTPPPPQGYYSDQSKRG